MSNTKRKIRLIILIPVIIIVILGATILALSLIKVNPILDNFGGYDRIELLVSADTASGHIKVDGKDITQEAFDDGLDESGFSVMQGILEGKFSYNLTLKTEKVVENEKEVDKEVTVGAKDIKEYFADEGEYVFRFSYKDVKTIKVKDKEIKFDSLLLKIKESNGEIEEMECIPYLIRNVYNDAPTVDEYDENGYIGSVYYSTYVLNVKMITSKLIIDISDVITA